MDRSDVISLVSYTYEADGIGQLEPTAEKNEVFANIKSVGRNEFFAAGEAGIRPEIVATVFAHDYSGEKEVEYNDKMYRVYRAFLAQDEKLELYLEEKVGQ